MSIPARQRAAAPFTRVVGQARMPNGNRACPTPGRNASLGGGGGIGRKPHSTIRSGSQPIATKNESKPHFCRNRHCRAVDRRTRTGSELSIGTGDRERGIRFDHEPTFAVPMVVDTATGDKRDGLHLPRVSSRVGRLALIGRTRGSYLPAGGSDGGVTPERLRSAHDLLPSALESQGYKHASNIVAEPKCVDDDPGL